MTTRQSTNIHTRGAENLRLEISSVWDYKTMPLSVQLLEGTCTPIMTLFLHDGDELRSLIKSMEEIIEQVKNNPRLQLAIMTDKVEAS